MASPFRKPVGVNPMQGFSPSDIPTSPKEFTRAAKVLELVAGEGDPWFTIRGKAEVTEAELKRVANVLTTMAAAFASQASAVEEFERAKKEGRLVGQ